MPSGQGKHERQLVERCLAGERQAWDEFFDTHYRRISAIASWRKWHFDPVEREDVMQEILTEVVRSLKTFEFKARVRTFIHKVAVITCVAHLRKKTRQKRGSKYTHVPINPTDNGWGRDDEEIPLSSLPNPEELLLKSESLSAVRKALAGLGERCKQLIRLRYFSELSFAEISKQTGVKENTLVINMRRCLLRLIHRLQGENEYE